MKRNALGILSLIAALVLVARPALAVDLIVDNGAPGTSAIGAWCVSGAAGSFGPSSLYNCGGSSQDVYRWTPALATSGRYDVYLWWTTYPTRETDALFRITEQGGAVTLKTVNQKVNGGQWNHIGSYTFGPSGPSTGGYVEALGLNGQVNADAVRWVSGAAAPAALTAADLTSDFEMGRGTNFTDVGPNTIQIDAERDPGQAWTSVAPHFKIVRNALNQSPIFRIRYGWGGFHSYGYNPSTPTPSSTADALAPVYSYDDGATWLRFPSDGTYDHPSDTATFQSPVFTQDSVLIALWEPYRYSVEYANDRARWLASPYVALATLGLSVQGRDVELFKITNPGSSLPEAQKKVYFIMRSGHPFEYHASWRLRGMIDWALSSDPEAIRFRDTSVLLATFTANVDGWVHGYSRVNVCGQDMNRDFEYTGANPALEEPETYAIHRYIDDYMTTNHIDVLLDMHTSSSPGGEETYRANNMPPSAALTQLRSIVTSLDVHHLLSPRALDPDGYPITTYTDGFYAQHAARGVSAFMMEGATRHKNGSTVTPASSEEVGRIWLQAFFRWLNPRPTLALSTAPSSISAGQSATVSWSSTHAASCSASGAWSGAKPLSGSATVSPTAPATYTLTCVGNGASVTRSATVTVTGTPPPATEVIIDNGAPGTVAVGAWCVSGAAGSYGPSSLYNCGGNSADVYRFTPSLGVSGRYALYLWWTTFRTREPDALFRITEQGGAVTLKTVNQQVNGGQWNYVGTYTFGPSGPSTGGHVEALGGNGQVNADAVRWVRVP